MRTTFIALAAVFCASAGGAETVEKELLCSSVMPALLEFTGAIPKAMDALSEMHDQTMSSETARNFDAVAAKGLELKADAEEFRKLFVLACYAN